MFVKPCEGRAVRDPTTRALLAVDGEEKPDTRFWRRRVRDKDVEEVKRPAGVEGGAQGRRGQASRSDHRRYRRQCSGKGCR